MTDLLPPRPVPLSCLALVVIAVVLAHGSALSAGWLGADASLVRDDPAIQAGLGGLPEVVGDGRYPPSVEGQPYRPVTRFSWALAASMGDAREPSPTLDHALNVGLHLLAALLLFALIRACRPDRPWLALGAAGVWGLHPMHVGTVTALSGRADLLAVVLSLAAAWAWSRASSAGFAWRVVALLAAFLAFASKETALVLVPALALFASTTSRSASAEAVLARPSRAARLGWLAAFALPIALFLALWNGVPAASPYMPEAEGAAPAVRAFALGEHALRLVSPVRLQSSSAVDAMLAGRFALGEGSTLLLALLALATLAAGARVVTGKAGVPAWAWLSFVVVGGVAALLQPMGAVFSLRFAYVACLPLVLIGGWLLEGAMRELGPRGHALAIAVGLLAAGGLATLSALEGPHHHNDQVRYERRLALRPDDVPAMERLSEHFRRASTRARSRLATMPTNASGRDPLIAEIRGGAEKARQWAQRAVQHPKGRDRSSAHAQLGLATSAVGRQAESLPHLLHAVRLDPMLRDSERLRRLVAAGRAYPTAELLYAIGRVQEVMGAPEEAAEPYLQAARLAPDRFAYVRKAGLALNAVERFPEGMVLLENAWSMARGSERSEMDELLRQQREARARLADKALRAAKEASGEGAYKSAINELKHVVAIDPDHVQALMDLGWLLGWWSGRYVEAFEHLAHAESLLLGANVDNDDPLLAQIRKRRSDLQAQKQREDEEELGGD